MWFTTLVCCLSLLGVVHADPAARELRVSAAVSMKEALTACGDEFARQSGTAVKFNFGASGELAAQIEQGARVDLFISAANRQVEDLLKADALVPSSRVVVARNDLVLIVPADAKAGPASFEDLKNEKLAPKVAMGNPKFVPAGQYAEQVLKSYKVEARQRTVLAANVRQVLDYVARGEVSAGIVYKTDALLAGDKVRVVATADSKLHDAIEYPAAIVKGAGNASDAEAFLKFLRSEKGQEMLSKAGFKPAE